MWHIVLANEVCAAAQEAQLERAHAEAARLAADNAALRGRLAKTHRLVGAMQVQKFSLHFSAEVWLYFAVSLGSTRNSLLTLFMTVSPGCHGHSGHQGWCSC